MKLPAGAKLISDHRGCKAWDGGDGRFYFSQDDEDPWTSTYDRAGIEATATRVREFWDWHAATADNPDKPRIGGVQYTIGPPRPDLPPDLRGCAGRVFVIVFNDGRRVETSNLWHNGRIPSGYREAIPDNARFGEQP